MKEDVKNKLSPSPPGEDEDWRLASSPASFVEGFLVLPLWIAGLFSGDANPSCLSQANSFM